MESASKIGMWVIVVCAYLHILFYRPKKNEHDILMLYRYMLLWLVLVTAFYMLVMK